MSSIIIPGWHPTPLNKLREVHWSVARNMKRFDAQMIGVYAMGLDRAKGRRLVDLEIVYPPGKRRHDEDAFWKTTLDALVACRMLINDSTIWCKTGTVTLIRGTTLETTITLTDIDPLPKIRARKSRRKNGSAKAGSD